MKTRKLKSSFGIAPALQNTELERRKAQGRPSAAVKKSEPLLSAKTTEIAARIDVGLGNTLFIRGQGDGLSWDKGTPLNCLDASTWVWSRSPAKDRVVFKLLLNDAIWSQGEDVVVEPGRRIEVVPCF